MDWNKLQHILTSRGDEKLTEEEKVLGMQIGLGATLVLGLIMLLVILWLFIFQEPEGEIGFTLSIIALFGLAGFLPKIIRIIKLQRKRKAMQKENPNPSSHAHAVVRKSSRWNPDFGLAGLLIFLFILFIGIPVVLILISSLFNS